MNSDKMVNYAIYAFNARHAEATNTIRYGDLEIVLRDGVFHFVSRGGARISNIREINFFGNLSLSLMGLTDDVTQIPPEYQRFYAMSALSKLIQLGQFQLTEGFISDFLGRISSNENSVQAINIDLTTINNSVETINISISTINNAIQTIESEINNILLSIEDIQYLDQIKTDVENLLNDATQMQQDIQTIKDNISVLDNWEHMQDQVDSLNTTIGNLQTQILNHTHTVSQITDFNTQTTLNLLTSDKNINTRNLNLSLTGGNQIITWINNNIPFLFQTITANSMSSVK